MSRAGFGWALLVAAGLVAAGCTSPSSTSAAGPSTKPATVATTPVPKNLVTTAPVPLGGPIKGVVVLPRLHGDVKAYTLGTLRAFETIAHSQGLPTKPVGVMFIPAGKAVSCGHGGFASDAGRDATDAYACEWSGGTILIGPKTLAGEVNRAKFDGAFGALMYAYTSSQDQVYGTNSAYMIHIFRGCYDGVIMRWLYHAGQVGKDQVLAEEGMDTYGGPGFQAGFMTGRCSQADFGKDPVGLLMNAGFDAPRS